MFAVLRGMESIYAVKNLHHHLIILVVWIERNLDEASVGFMKLMDYLAKSPESMLHYLPALSWSIAYVVGLPSSHVWLEKRMKFAAIS